MSGSRLNLNFMTIRFQISAVKWDSKGIGCCQDPVEIRDHVTCSCSPISASSDLNMLVVDAGAAIDRYDGSVGIGSGS